MHQSTALLKENKEIIVACYLIRTLLYPNHVRLALGSYCLYDTHAFIEENGRRSYQSSDGALHLEGPACFASKARLEPTVKRTLPLFDSAKDSPKAVITPIPRFVTGPFCTKPTHATNAGTQAYKDSIKPNLAGVGRSIREICSAQNIKKIRVLNVTATIMDMPLEAAWAGIEVTSSAYTAMLRAILSESSAMIQKRPLPTPKRPAPKRHHSEQSGTEPHEHADRSQRQSRSVPDLYEADRYAGYREDNRRVQFQDEGEHVTDWLSYRY